MSRGAPARENHQDTPVIDIKDQLRQLFKDISRGKYQFPGVNDQIESTGSTNKQACLLDFLDKLTPEQQRSLNIVGTQIAPITLKNVVYQASAEHAFIGNPTAKYQFDICPEQKVLLAYVSLEQNHDANYFDTLKSGYGSGYETARYPNLGAQAIFSITEAR